GRAVPRVVRGGREGEVVEHVVGGHQRVELALVLIERFRRAVLDRAPAAARHGRCQQPAGRRRVLRVERPHVRLQDRDHSLARDGRRGGGGRRRGGDRGRGRAWLR